LLLPAGSSTYSATVCFALGDWHLRLFDRNVGVSPRGSRAGTSDESVKGIPSR